MEPIADLPLSPPLTIGWRERVALPDWGIDPILAKIDTGARTSAIHAEDIVAVDDDTVGFTIVLSRKRPTRRSVRVHAPIARHATVRSSNGVVQHRYTVLTTLRLGSLERTIEVTLSSRRHMLRRLLLGRSALAGLALIDVARERLLEAAKEPL